MQTYLLSGSLFLTTISAPAQSIERKIVVEKSQFRYISIDAETQLAHLHTAAIRQKPAEADDHILPSGRNSEEPVNPFCFSLRGNELISVNWILHPLNSRYEAIRKTDLSQWWKARPDWHTEEWAEASFAQPMLAPNEPWQRMLEVNSILSDCYFDLIAADKQLVMAICNQGQMRLFRWDGSVWSSSKAFAYTDKAAFSLLAQGDRLALWTAAGNLYRWEPKRNQLKCVRKGLKKNLLIVEDLDHRKHYLLDPMALEAQTASSFESILNESGMELTF